MEYMVVGLGNPGTEYAQTRHNAGFMALDALACACGVSYWKSEAGAKTARVTHGDITLLLVKPLQYMNLSGNAVASLAKKYRIAADRIIVLHDELDVKLGSLKLKQGGGTAGHNGLKSICEKLGSRDFFRIRIGIERPPGRMPVADYVLARPRKEELELLEAQCAKAAKAVLLLLDTGLENAQQKCNHIE